MPRVAAPSRCSELGLYGCIVGLGAPAPPIDAVLALPAAGALVAASEADDLPASGVGAVDGRGSTAGPPNVEADFDGALSDAVAPELVDVGVLALADPEDEEEVEDGALS